MVDDSTTTFECQVEYHSSRQSRSHVVDEMTGTGSW